MCIRDSNLPVHKSSLDRKQIIAEIINAETVVKAMVDQKDQDQTRFLINEKFNKIIKNLYNNVHSSIPLTNTNYNKKRKISIGLKQKLSDNKALMTKADEGNTVVIMDREDYNNKIQNFIINNNNWFTKF